MFETSKDILNIVIAACIVVLTFFMSWGLYYVVMLLKRAYVTTREISELIELVKRNIEHVQSLIGQVEEKVKHSASYLPLIFKAVMELAQLFKRKQEKRSKNKSAAAE